MCVCVCVRMCPVAQSCLTLCSPMDWSPPGSSVHRIFQARLLEWVASSLGFPGGTGGKEPIDQCRGSKRGLLDPWSRKIPSRRKWQHTAVVLPGESPWTEEPGGLQSMGSQRVEHDRSNLTQRYSKCILKVQKYYVNISLAQRRDQDH